MTLVSEWLADHPGWAGDLFCAGCGAPTVVEVHEGVHDTKTGERHYGYMAVCSRQRWWKPWEYHSRSYLISPPPKTRG